MHESNWFWYPRKVVQPRIRFFCFPHAGAGASALPFRDWAPLLPPDVELVVVELPGRGRRFREPLLWSMPQVIDSLSASFEKVQLSTPFVFFGHSLGALIAFELARWLQSGGKPRPEFLIVSGRRAPHFPETERLSDLPEAEFLQSLRNYEGTPSQFFDNPELMTLLAAILRADFRLAEDYRCEPGPPLHVPMAALGGLGDERESHAGLLRWQDHGSAAFDCRMFPGGHFYLQDEGRREVQDYVFGVVRAVLARLRVQSLSATG